MFNKLRPPRLLLLLLQICTTLRIHICQDARPSPAVPGVEFSALFFIQDSIPPYCSASHHHIREREGIPHDPLPSTFLVPFIDLIKTLLPVLPLLLCVLLHSLPACFAKHLQPRPNEVLPARS